MNPFIPATQIIEESGIRYISLLPGTKLLGERSRGSASFCGGSGDEPWKKRPRVSALEKQAMVNRAVLFINTAVRRALDNLSRSRLQTYMRTAPDSSEEVFSALKGALEHSTDARVTLRLFAVADYLFMHSGGFRSIAVEHISDLFFVYCCDVEYAQDRRSAVPGPLFAAGRLIGYSRKAVERWAVYFGGRYPQLVVASDLMKRFLSKKEIVANYKHDIAKKRVLSILESAASGEYSVLKEDVSSTIKAIDGCFNILVPNLDIDGSFLYDTDDDKCDKVFPWEYGDDEEANKLYGIQDENDDDDESSSGSADNSNSNNGDTNKTNDIPFLFFDENGSNESEASEKPVVKTSYVDSHQEIFSFSDLFSDDDDEVNDGNDAEENGQRYVVPGFIQGCSEIVIELSDNGASDRVTSANKSCVADELDECDKAMNKSLIPKVNKWIKAIDQVKTEELYDEPILLNKLRECRKVAVNLLAEMNKKKNQRKQLNC